MSKDNNINVKLEVCKDKTTGKLLIMAHFNSKAPNIIEGKDGTYWLPTIEEKNLLYEAFQLITVDKYTDNSEIIDTLPETDETKYSEEPIIEDSTKPSSDDKYEEYDVNKNDLSQTDQSNEQDLYNVTDEQIKEEDYTNKDTTNDETQTNKTDKNTKDDEEYNLQENDKIIEDDGLIVEADSEAIEAALQKHSEKDKTIVEADEQTIIDKVLSQKKKGKWSKR